MATILRVIPEDTYNNLVQLGVLDDKQTVPDTVAHEPVEVEPAVDNEVVPDRIEPILNQLDEQLVDRQQARRALEQIVSKGVFDWNDSGEIIYGGRVFIGTNIANLFQSLYDKSKCSVHGAKTFWKILQQENLISQFINIKEVTSDSYPWTSFEQEFIFET